MCLIEKKSLLQNGTINILNLIYNQRATLYKKNLNLEFYKKVKA